MRNFHNFKRFLYTHKRKSIENHRATFFHSWLLHLHIYIAHAIRISVVYSMCSCDISLVRLLYLFLPHFISLVVNMCSWAYSWWGDSGGGLLFSIFDKLCALCGFSYVYRNNLNWRPTVKRHPSNYIISNRQNCTHLKQ